MTLLNSDILVCGGEVFPHPTPTSNCTLYVSASNIWTTFSPLPGLESKRPESKTKFPNYFLAGDWTKCGWPATMEGAVRSGYKAAEAVLASK